MELSRYCGLWPWIFPALSTFSTNIMMFPGLARPLYPSIHIKIISPFREVRKYMEDRPTVYFFGTSISHGRWTCRLLSWGCHILRASLSSSISYDVTLAFIEVIGNNGHCCLPLTSSLPYFNTSPGGSSNITSIDSLHTRLLPNQLHKLFIEGFRTWLRLA